MTDIRQLIRTHWLVIVVVLFAAIQLLGLSHAAAQSVDPTPVPLVTGTIRAAEATTNIMGNFFDRLTQAPQSNIMRVLLVAVGLVLLVAGWRVYEFVIIIAGAMVGAAIATSLVTSTDAMTNVLALLIGGVIGAVLSAFLYYVAVFLVGMHFGILLTNGLATLFNLQPISPLVLILGGVIGGLILVGLSFEFLIILSSLVGGQMLSMGLGLGPIWVLIFAVVGIVVQFALTQTYHYDFRRRHRYYRRIWANN